MIHAILATLWYNVLHAASVRVIYAILCIFDKAKDLHGGTPCM